MASSSSSSQEGMQQVAENFILQQFSKMRAEAQAYAQKLAEVEMDLREHSLVYNTISKLPNERKCFRLIGGVLVERTVGEVSPALEKNIIKLGQFVNDLESQLKQKQEEIAAFATKYQIQARESAEDED